MIKRRIIRFYRCVDCPYGEITEPDPTAVNAKGHLHCKLKDRAIYDEFIPYWCPLEEE